MRKKELLKLNEDLFNRLDAAKLALDDIKKENAKLKAELERLKEDNARLEAKESVSEPLKALEEKLTTAAAVSAETEYGATVIGKIVVSAAKYCNSLAASPDSTDVKELINLILGRTEVAKAEILKTVSSELELEEKKNLINEQQKSAEDYFNSVMAQKT